MLSSDDYYDFSMDLSDLLEDCSASENAGAGGEVVTADGLSAMTLEQTYFFLKEETEKVTEDLLDIIKRLPLDPPREEGTCATVLYVNLLPEGAGMGTEMRYACSMADQFIRMCELAGVGHASADPGQGMEMHHLLIEEKWRDRLPLT